MFKIIKEIIVKWDPVGLMGFAPKDEYDDECYLIVNELEKKQESLDMTIYRVFSDRFGETFQSDFTSCMETAVEIENRINKK